MTDPNAPERKSCSVNGIDLSYAERHPDLRGRGPTLLFAHATGFHARVWDQTIAALPPVHSICIDLRGHGLSSGGSFDDWGLLGADIGGLIDGLALETVVGIGHSIGGHALTDAASARPDRMQALVLIDPVIMAPPFYKMADKFFPKPGHHPAAQRKRDFASVEEMKERFRDRPPYALFTPEALEDYCRHGLVPAAGGIGLTLACTPETEATAYTAVFSKPGIFDSLAHVACPVTVVRANPMDMSTLNDFTRSPTWPDLADAFPNGTDISRPDLSHFMPMQDPAFTASVIAKAAELAGAAQPA